MAKVNPFRICLENRIYVKNPWRVVGGSTHAHQFGDARVFVEGRGTQHVEWTRYTA